MIELHNKIIQQIPVNEAAIDKAIEEACASGDNLLERLRIIYKIGYRGARWAVAELAEREGK